MTARWEYTAVPVDARRSLNAQPDVLRGLSVLGGHGWEVYAITPMTPPDDSDDPVTPEYEVLLKRRADEPPVPWEYEAVGIDTWMGVAASGDGKARLRELGEEGWEAFAVTPPTVPPGPGALDPDESSYDILLRRRADG